MCGALAVGVGRRIINRFSKDVQVVDGDLPYYLNHVCTTSAAAIVTMVLAALSTLWLTPIALIVRHCYHLAACVRRVCVSV